MIMANSGTLVNPPSSTTSSYSHASQATANVASSSSANTTTTAAAVAQPQATQPISNQTSSISAPNHRTLAQPPPPQQQQSSSSSQPAAAAPAATTTSQSQATSNSNAKTPSPTPPAAAATAAAAAVSAAVPSTATTTTTTSTTTTASSVAPAATVAASAPIAAAAAPTSTSTTTTTVTTTPAATSSNQPPRTTITSNDQRWIFSVDKIANSPSRSDMSAEEEAGQRLKAALFIHELGSKIKVNQLCVNTALIYMHRFFMIHSFKKFHPNIVATACLFFACKVEEQPRRLREFIDSVHTINRKPHDLAPHNSEEYRRYGDEIVVLESCILQTLGFNVLVNHAHTVIIKTCQMIKAPRDLAEAAYLTATNSLIISNFCVKFSSEKVACFCIYLACKWTGLKIPTSSEGMQWYQYVNPNINEQELEEITKEYLAIYEQVPEKVKRKLGKTKANDEVDNQHQQHLQKHKPVDLNKTAPSALQAAQKQHSQNPNSIHGQNQPSGPVMKKHPISNSTSSLSVNQTSSSSSSSSNNTTNIVHSQQQNKMNYNSHSNNHYQQQQQQQHNSQVKQSMNQQHVKSGQNAAAMGQPHNIAYSNNNSNLNRSNQPPPQQQQQHRSNRDHHLSFNGADEGEPKAKMNQYSNSMSNLNSMTAAIKKPPPPQHNAPASAPFLPAANGNAGLKMPGAAAAAAAAATAAQSQQSPAKSLNNNSTSMKRGNEEFNSPLSSVPSKIAKDRVGCMQD